MGGITPRCERDSAQYCGCRPGGPAARSSSAQATPRSRSPVVTNLALEPRGIPPLAAPRRLRRRSPPDLAGRAMAGGCPGVRPGRGSELRRRRPMPRDPAGSAAIGGPRFRSTFLGSESGRGRSPQSPFPRRRLPTSRDPHDDRDAHGLGPRIGADAPAGAAGFRAGREAAGPRSGAAGGAAIGGAVPSRGGGDQAAPRRGAAAAAAAAGGDQVLARGGDRRDVPRQLVAATCDQRPRARLGGRLPLGAGAVRRRGRRRRSPEPATATARQRTGRSARAGRLPWSGASSTTRRWIGTRSRRNSR